MVIIKNNIMRNYGFKYLKKVKTMLLVSSIFFAVSQPNDQWQSHDFHEIMFRTSINGNYHSIQDYLTIHGDLRPSGWTFFRRLKRNSLKKISSQTNKILQDNFRDLVKKGKYTSGPLYLAVDGHLEPYYGKRKDWHTTGVRKKSTNTFIAISALCIVHPHRPLPIAFAPLLATQEAKTAQELLQQTKKLFAGFKVIFLGDGRYTNINLVKQLDQLGYSYMIRHRRMPGVPKQLCEGERASKLKIKEGFIVKHRLLRARKNPIKAWTYLMIARQALLKKSKKIPVIDSDVFCWITNYPKLGARRLLKLYKRRFRIENVFRDLRPFLIRSCSPDPKVRFALIAWALLLYSQIEYMILSEPQIIKTNNWSFNRCWFWPKPLNQCVLIATVCELLE